MQSTATLCLGPDELVALTRKERHAAQARELEALGIPYRKRRDGSLVVMRADASTRPVVEKAEPRLRFVS